MRSLLLLFFSALLLLSCFKKRKKTEETTGSAELEILDVDRTFSAMSASKGLRHAYMEFIDSNGVLLRPGNLPLIGGNAMNFITESNDSAFTMTWEPRHANASATSDLGYTYGIYSIKPSRMDTVFYGTYVTIWKRQPDGNWRFVLQSANDGIE